jgi:uncharacterized protein with von Willebrand factor type A (vWA) domain
VSGNTSAQPFAASDRVTAFAAYLREYGFSIGVAETADLLEAARLLSTCPPRMVSQAWRSVACRTPAEWSQWDELFTRYWHPEQVRGTVKVTGRTQSRRDLRSVVEDLKDRLSAESRPSGNPPPTPTGAALETPSAEMPGDSAALPQAMGGASRVDPLHDRQSTMWWPDELVQLQLLARQIYRDLRPLRTRRFERHRRVDRLDIRGTLRRSAAWGGALMMPIWRTPQRIPPRIFIFVDVSRSMESHAAFCLRVARAFVREADARVFVFHTKIIEVTALMSRDSGRIQEKINAVTAGFGGGTRIASCLRDFAQGEGRAALRRGARVWILSDGYDTDEPTELHDALRSLRRSGGHIVWFHPTKTYALSTALSAARRVIDDYLPLTTLTDLRAAAARLR